MKRNKIALAGLALLTAGTLALAGCAGGGSDEPSKAPGGDTSAIITTNGTEPENPLVPTNTNEVGGGTIVDNLFAGLGFYDADGKFMAGRELVSRDVVDAKTGEPMIESVILSVSNVKSHPGKTLAGCTYSLDIPAEGEAPAAAPAPAKTTPPA